MGVEVYCIYPHPTTFTSAKSPKHFIKSLKIDLEASKKAQAGYMAAGDLQTIQAEAFKKISANMFSDFKSHKIKLL